MESTNKPDSARRGLGLGTLFLLTSLAACDSGGVVDTVGVAGPLAGPVLQVDFSLRRDIGLGSTFVGDVLHKDLNADGIEDLVETNFLPMQISIAFGNPDGSFSTIAQRATVGHAWRLAVGDFDNDGDTDIAVASHNYRGTGTPGVELFLQGPGLGEFTAAPIGMTLAVNPVDLTAGPRSGVVGSGGPDDLFVALRNERRVALLGLNGSVLSETGSLESSNLGMAGGPLSVAVIDLGGDGELDLVVGEVRLIGAPDRVVHYARDMSAATNFQPAAMVMSPVFMPVVDNVGDVDSNTYEDIAVAQRAADEVYLLNGDASGLSQATALDLGGRTTSLIFPDLDGDGLAEAVATLLDQSSVQVLPGTGPMAWGEAIHYSVGPVPRAIDVILLPGDLVPDLLCGNTQELAVLQGLGAGLFRGARGYATGVDAPRGMVTADLDNNGTTDAVVVSLEQRQIAFLSGGSDGTFKVQTVLPLMPTVSETANSLAIADMDVDGRLDVVVSVAALNEVRFYTNNGEIDSFVDPLPSHVTAVGSDPAGIAVGQLNGDALPDVVVSNRGDNTHQVLLNMGAGVLSAQTPLTLPFTPLGSMVMDFDLDGNMDVAVFGDTGIGYVLTFLAGDGTGNMAISNSYAIPGPSNGAAMGDFNGDGAVDIVVGQALDSSTDVIVLINEGGLSFAVSNVTIGPAPGKIMVSDINNDGNLDLVIATVLGQLRIALGDGEGAFPAILPAGHGELSLTHLTLDGALGDINNDRLPDLMTVSPLSPFLWVGLNASTPVQEL